MGEKPSQAGEFRRGPGGRPSAAEAERRQKILLDCAARLFFDAGYDAVSIDEISRRSGVAKRFIYARFKDKSEIFVAAIGQFFRGRLEALHAFAPSSENAEEGLARFGAKLLEIVLDPDALALNRLFLTAAPRFPELARLFVERNRHQSLGDIVRLLNLYADRGEIEIADRDLLAEQFFIQVAGIPQRLALLGLREPPEQEARRLRSAVRLFLAGCGKRGRKA
jgi:TetR/AcrR family transcriptional regulator, mexJK operon transcriptional repressor